MVWIGRDLQGHPVPSPWDMDPGGSMDPVPLDQVASSPIQRGLEFQNMMGKHIKRRDAAFETTCNAIPVGIMGHPGWF